jgi:hypothetical protein
MRSKGTWYVSFEPKGRARGTRTRTRLAESFQTEQEAKAFARAKLADGLNVSAGTLNPYQPKRIVTSAQIHMIGSKNQDDENRPLPPRGGRAGALFRFGGAAAPGSKGGCLRMSERFSAAWPL